MYAAWDKDEKYNKRLYKAINPPPYTNLRINTPLII